MNLDDLVKEPINIDDDGYMVAAKLFNQECDDFNYISNDPINIPLARMDLMFLKAIAVKAQKREISRAKKFQYPISRMWCVFGRYRCRNLLEHTLYVMRRELSQAHPWPEPTETNIRLLKLVYNYMEKTHYVDPIIDQIIVPWNKGEDLVYNKLAFEPSKSFGTDRSKGALAA